MDDPEELLNLSSFGNELFQEVFGLVKDGVRLIRTGWVTCVTEPRRQMSGEGVKPWRR